LERLDLFPLLYDAFVRRGRVLKGDRLASEIRARLEYLLKEKYNHIAFALFKTAFNDIFYATHFMSKRGDLRSALLRTLLAGVTFIQSLELVDGLPPSGKYSLLSSRVFMRASPEDKRFIRMIVALYGLLKSDCLILRPSFVWEVWEMTFNFIADHKVLVLWHV